MCIHLVKKINPITISVRLIGTTKASYDINVADIFL